MNSLMMLRLVYQVYLVTTAALLLSPVKYLAYLASHQAGRESR